MYDDSYAHIMIPAQHRGMLSCAARQPKAPASALIRVVLVVCAAVATWPPHTCADAVVIPDVSSFSELQQGIALVMELQDEPNSQWNFRDGISEKSVISIASPAIRFHNQLDVSKGAAVTVESTVGSTLDGNGEIRLFYLHNSSVLSLRGVNLVRGRCSGRDCRGGAIFVAHESELILSSVRLSMSESNVGGAIFATSSIVTAKDCTMSSNSAELAGGAIFALDSVVNITHCTMSKNEAELGGAVIMMGRAVVTSTNCTFTSNTAFRGGAVLIGGDSTFTTSHCTMTANSATWGGALAGTEKSTVVVRDSTISSNSAGWGGAIFLLDRSFVAARDCTMTENFAHSKGGVFTAYDLGTVTATRCLMTNNFAFHDGGGAFFLSSNAATSITDCTMTSNTAMSPGTGGVVRAVDNSIFTANGCTMNDNSAAWGGAVFAADHATIAARNCTMTFNSGDFGGGVVAMVGDSDASASNCTMSLNFGGWGGAVFAGDDATFTATGCGLQMNRGYYGAGFYAEGKATMHQRFNTVVWNYGIVSGGGIYAQGESTITVSTCVFDGNRAWDGGAVYVVDGSRIKMTNSIMTENFAIIGGAVLTAGFPGFGSSHVIMTNCTMASNSARDRGGAVYAEPNSTFATTDCAMISNYASFGGAVFADNASHVDISTSRFESNRAQVGAAAVVSASGTIALTNSVFESNFAISNDSDGVGIVNFGGNVECDTTRCLQVCTLCGNKAEFFDGGKLPPPQPATHTASGDRVTMALSAVIGCGALFAVCAMSVMWWQCRVRKLCCRHENTHRGREGGANGTLVDPLICALLTADHRDEQAYLHDAAADRSESSTSADTGDSTIEMARMLDTDVTQSATVDDMVSTHSIVRSVMASSPAPILVVDRQLRITLWSPGMRRAAPMLIDPVGRRISELPFVEAHSRTRCVNVIRRMFAVLEEQSSVQSSVQIVMLHLRAQTGHALLEMEANILGTSCEPIVVLTGCRVDSQLAGLIACDVTATSDSCGDELPEHLPVALDDVRRLFVEQRHPSAHRRTDDDVALQRGTLLSGVSDDDASGSRNAANICGDGTRSKISSITCPEDDEQQ